jgi:CelD/BcsL family acetyltransferase involved in cellulose biosynthesis
MGGTGQALMHTPRAAGLASARAVDGALNAEWTTPSAMTSGHIAEWQNLCGAMAEPNVAIEPAMLLPALSHLAKNGEADMLMIRDARRTLVGVMPVSVAPALGRMPIRTAQNWTHPNAFVAAIAMAAGQEAAVWAAALPAIAQHHATPAFMARDIVADSGIARGLTAAAAQLGLPTAVEEQISRAMLATTLDPETYWDASVRAKKRKELRRQWARLSECGALTTAHLASDDDARVWIDEFLTLELSGWKGREGSALASARPTRAFFTDAMLAMHAQGQLAVTALRIDGRAIAMLITSTAKTAAIEAGFSFKTAYDENYARFSPGVLLQRESLGLLHARGLAWIDSCAAQDHPMIDSLWQQRRVIESISLPLPGARNRMVFGAMQTAKRGWHAAKRLRGGAVPASPATTSEEPQ